MSKEIFKVIKESLKNYRFTSLNYTEYEDIKDYEITSNNKDLILLYGLDKEKNLYEYHFAANKVEDLIRELRKDEDKALITFIPDEWTAALEKNNFKVFALWNDYRNENIEDTIAKTAAFEETAFKVEALKESDAAEISEVTLACRGQSRGFTGQSQEWVKKWIRQEDPWVKGSDAKNCCVLGCRYQDRLVGIICLAAYGYNGEKGPILWIRELAVAPEYSGQGIGRALLRAGLSYGKTIGTKRGFLMADECNNHAIRLYNAFSFMGIKENAQRDMIRE